MARRVLQRRRRVGVLYPSDAGLADAERLQHFLVPERSNGVAGAARQVGNGGGMRSAGLAASDQAATDTWEELKAFLDAHSSRWCSSRGAASGIFVGLAHDEAQARGMQETLGSFSSFVRSTAATSTSAARASAS